MGFPSIFSNIKSDLQPVYNVAEFGEDIALVVPSYDPTLSAPLLQGTPRHLLDPSECNVNITEFGGGAPTSSVTVTARKLLDMPAWIFGLQAKVMGQTAVAAGNTSDITVRTQVIIYKPDGSSQTIYDDTQTQTAVSTGVARHIEVWHPFKALATLAPQHSQIEVIHTLTITRTAGASNNNIGYNPFNTSVTQGFSGIKIHLHPHLNHSDLIFGTERPS